MKKVVRISLACFIFLFMTAPQTFYGALKTKPLMPEFLDISFWINGSSSPRKADFLGKVLAVYFWNCSDSRSIRELDYLNQWLSLYEEDGLAIIGIHVPEYGFENDEKKLHRFIRKLEVLFPIGMDAKKSTWRVYQQPAISSLILIDKQNQIRETFSRHADYQSVEKKIFNLLEEIQPIAPLRGDDVIKYPQYETYQDYRFGYRNNAGYGNKEPLKADVLQKFEPPTQRTPNVYYLKGHWKTKEESLELARVPSEVSFTAESAQTYLLGGSARNTLTPVEIRIDGEPLNKRNKGRNIVLKDKKSYVFLKEYQLYQLVNLRKKTGRRKIDLIFEEPGAELYKLSFE